ncbi:ribosomal protein L37AE/L43A [Halarchaeum solikamskense]|jgi:ribosomal protein L37AE/L43A|uniref:hypothetical protein n=1 Tax=Halarchaeum nitratireducens TaxID=489913 RepID=UPI001B3A87D2|nr:hypothetical protein [Halarchaeum solikamskense]MBP2252767.1 ribosomal protein L37AE/L43A [Halarchaeum solikamskense]
MKAVPSYTVDRETAATLREWLFEHAVEKHGESEISEPLAELAAAIDGALYEEAEAVELGAWARAGPLGHRDTSRVDGSPVDESRSDDAREPAGPDVLDMGISKSDRIYDTLPDSAWQLDHDQSTTNRERSRTAASHGKATPTATSRTRRQQHRPSVRYRTAYECSVCGSVRELETSLRVCAFVDECPSCGAVARFTAGGIPTPFRKI